MPMLLLMFGSVLLYAPISAQGTDALPPLPNDLIFYSIYDAENDDGTVRRVDTLVLLDGETLMYTTLGENLGIPIQWSHQGDKIAVIRPLSLIDNDGIYELEVCVVTIMDVNEVCMDDTTELYYQSRFDITWSDDGQKIYFVTHRQETWQLLEADATTGATLRVIYETDYSREGWTRELSISWTPNLSHVAVGVGYNSPPGILVDLTTYEILDLSELLQPYLDQAAVNTAAGHSNICGSFSPLGSDPVFSPLGNYLVGIISILPDGEERGGRRYVILDTEGNMIKTFDIYFDRSAAPPSCPVWSEDESKFYITARDWQEHGRLIYQYSFEDDEFTPYFSAGLEIDTVISPSPDEAYMVFPGYFGDGYAVYVLYPDGIIRRFCEDGHSCHSPLWRPNSE